MKSLVKKSVSPLGIVIAAFILIVVVFGVILVSRAYAAPQALSAGQKLITIHDRGHDRGILTYAATLRDAFKEARITLDPNDTVEPGLDEALIANNYEVNVYRARPVTIVDGSIRKKVMSPYRTAEQIAKHADIALHDEDVTAFAASSDMVREGAGVQLTIERATKFTLLLYGSKTTAYTQEKTVADMLKKKHVTIGKNDTLSVPLNAKIKAGMTVELWRNGKQTVTEKQDIAFSVEQIQDMDHEIGYKAVKTPGKKGERKVTFEIEMKNGKEVGRKEIQSVVVAEPEKQVEIVGAKMSNTFDGSFAEALARLRSCEGSYTSSTGNGYYGAYQFDIGTWGGYGGFSNAAQAPPSVQDQKAWETYQRRGWQPWPSCSSSQGLQDIYR